MNIEKIKITNYRQYKKLELDFSPNKLQLIKGIISSYQIPCFNTDSQ